MAWTLDTVEEDLGRFDQLPDDFKLRSGSAVYGSTAHIHYEKYDDTTGRRYLRYAVGGPGSWNISAIALTDNTFYVYAPTLRMDQNHIDRARLVAGARPERPPANRL